MRPIVDLSYYQSPTNINYDRLCAAISGAIIRVAYGSGVPNKWSGPDPEWERHYFEFNKRDKPLGGFQYLTEYQPVEEQVEVMRKGIEGKRIRIGRWADVEVERGAEVLSKQTVHKYMQLAEAAMGEFGIYTSYWYWWQIMGGYYYTNRKLWVAHYGVVKPSIPMGWTSYWLWQNHDAKTGRIDGYNSGIDLNQFYGTQEQFDAWVNAEPIAVEPVPPLELYSPVPTGSWISQKFGENSTWYATSRGHNGVDYGVIVGTPITAAMDGVVEVSKEQTGGYGRHIRIRHEHGITIYGHLSQRYVQVGDVVTAKQVIGRSGGSLSDPYAGNSTGPHLHFEYRPFEPVDPLVAGSYVYNAVDTLPFTIDWEKELGKMLFQVEVLASSGLNVRRGIGTGYSVIRTEPKGAILSVYEETNGWFKVGQGEWISGNPTYSKRVPVSVPADTRLDTLWAWYKETHPE